MPVRERPRHRIVVTGARGLVGWELCRDLAALGDVVGLSRQELDLTDTSAIRRFMRDVRPTIVVNAAAFTDVDGAERQPEIARAVNVIAPGVLAEEAVRLDCGMIHLSTDYVFDGTKGAPYVESDAPNPLSVYGRTKLDGELAVAARSSAYLVVRTSWVYGPRGRTFFSRMVRGSGLPDEVRVVSDQVSVPTWVRGLCSALGAIVARLTADERGLVEATAAIAGTYHLVSAGGGTSPHGFAVYAATHPSWPSWGGARRLIEVRSADIPATATRPADTRLDTSLAASVLGVRIPAWRDQLALALEEP